VLNPYEPLSLRAAARFIYSYVNSHMRFAIAVIAALGLVCLVMGDEPKKTDKPAAPKPNDAPPPRPNISPEQMVDAILRRMDTDKDGKISRSEARDRIAENFDRIDTNKDGYLDRNELLAMARRSVAGPPGGRSGGPFGGPGGGPRPDPLDFDSFDKNADGRLTREELKGTRWHEVFDKIDTNKDGKIDPKEWAAYHGLNKK
jgi:Ca2+-binding EF-hand superfamily protein